MGGYQTKMRICSAVFIALMSIGLSHQTQAQDQSPEPEFNKDKPLWETDVQQFGFTLPGAGQHYHSSLEFTNDNRVIVSWTTLDGPRSGKVVGPAIRVPSHLDAVVLNGQTGQKMTAHEWSVPSFFATIRPVLDDKFIMCAGDEILLLSTDFDVIRKERLSGLVYCADDEISPSRRSFSIATGTAEAYRKTIVDSESLSVLANIATDQWGVHFTDKQIIAPCPSNQFCLRKFSESWQPFQCSGMDQQMKDYRSKSAFFLNDSTLAIQASNQMLVAKVDGSLVFKVNLPSRWLFKAPVTSSLGRRFAVMEQELRGATIEELDMYAFPSDDHLVVYDLPNREAIYARKVTGTSPWAPWTGHRNQLALSLDGTILAIFDRGIVRAYRLPSGKS
jgi:hypothetical protein